MKNAKRVKRDQDHGTNENERLIRHADEIEKRVGFKMLNCVYNIEYRMDTMELQHVYEVMEKESMLDCTDEKILFTNKNIIMAMLQSKSCCSILRMIPDDFSNDRNFILECVKFTKLSLRYLHGKFLNDYDIGLAAVKRYEPKGEFRYLSESLKRDKSIIVASSITWNETLLALDRDTWLDREITLLIVKSAPTAYKFVHPMFSTDVDILRIALSDPCNHEYFEVHPIDMEFCNDKLFVLDILDYVFECGSFKNSQKDPIFFIDESLKNDRDIHFKKYRMVDIYKDRVIKLNNIKFLYV